MLDQREIAVEKGSAKTVRDRIVASGGLEGKISPLCGKRSYEPRRLPFPAPEELNLIVSDCISEIIVRNDLHADSPCNLCQACIVIRLVIRSLQSLLSVFHTFPRDLIMTGG